LLLESIQLFLFRRIVIFHFSPVDTQGGGAYKPLIDEERSASKAFTKFLLVAG
jgi:hypothetical protein